MDEKEGLGLAKDVFATTKDLTGMSSRVGRYIKNINEKRPEIAQGLGVAAKICT